MKANSYALIAIALALTVTGCKKEKEEPEVTGVYLTKQSKIYNGHNLPGEYWLYIYDAGRIARITHFEDSVPDESEVYSYNTDGSLKKVEFEREYGIIGTYSFNYSDGKISSIMQDQGIYNRDTIEFSYSGDKVTATAFYATAVAHLNDQGQVTSLIFPRLERVDSIVYNWQDGNITALHFYDYSNKQLIHTREFEYDDKENYMNAIHYPAEWIFYFSLFNYENPEYYTKNNCTRFMQWNTGNNPDQVVYSYPEYSPDNYPLKKATQYYDYTFEYLVE